VDTTKLNKYFSEYDIPESYRLYTEYIWEIKEEINLQQDDHIYRRESIQNVLDKDPTIFTPEELQTLKETDQFILDNIEDAARWFHFWNYKDYPKKYWWRYAKFIANGDMNKPNLDKIYKPYFEEIKSPGIA
jgi:hypothetical protein